MSEPTPVEWLQAQVTNWDFKLKIQQQKTQKLKQIVQSIEKSTDTMEKLIAQGKVRESFNLIIEMNGYLHKECEATEKCDEITNQHYDALWKTMQVLTSKSNQVGQARTPEMGKFQSQMNTHGQMFVKQNVKHFNNYCDNFNNNKPKIDN